MKPNGAKPYLKIGDVARMAILGEPDSELKDFLAEIEAIELNLSCPNVDEAADSAAAITIASTSCLSTRCRRVSTLP